MWMPVVRISATPRALLRRRISPVGALRMGTRHAAVLRSRRPVLQQRVERGGSRWTSRMTRWRVVPLRRRRVTTPVRRVRPRVRVRRPARRRGSPVRVRRRPRRTVLGVVHAVRLLRALAGRVGLGRLGLLPLREVCVGLRSRGRHDGELLAPLSAQNCSEYAGYHSWSLWRLKRATLRPHSPLCQTL